jgi:hypothetical protein
MVGGVQILEGDELVIINSGEIRLKSGIPWQISTETAEKGCPLG